MKRGGGNTQEVRSQLGGGKPRQESVPEKRRPVNCAANGLKTDH